MKKIISYSLYNKRPKDCINAIINCLLAPKAYPNWIVKFYIDKTIPPEIDQLLRTFDYVQIKEMPEHKGSEAMTWRFRAGVDEPEYDTVFISRDADSWLNCWEAACVNQWLAGNKNFHILKSCCYHSQKIMGGLFGIRNSIIPKMAEEIDKFVNSGETYDQGFLASVIYDNITHDLMVHYRDPMFNNKGERVYGYLPSELINNGTAISMPPYDDKYDELIPGLSFREANKLNAFHCSHCGKLDDLLVGGITEIIPPSALQVVRNYATSKNISLDGLPGI